MTAQAAHVPHDLLKLYHALTMHSALNWLLTGSLLGQIDDSRPALGVTEREKLGVD